MHSNIRSGLDEENKKFYNISMSNPAIDHARPLPLMQPSNFVELKQLLQQVKSHPRFPELKDQPAFQDDVAFLERALAENLREPPPRFHARSLFPDDEEPIVALRTQSLIEAWYDGNQSTFPQGSIDAAKRIGDCLKPSFHASPPAIPRTMHGLRSLLILLASGLTKK